MLWVAFLSGFGLANHLKERRILEHCDAQNQQDCVETGVDVEALLDDGGPGQSRAAKPSGGSPRPGTRHGGDRSDGPGAALPLIAAASAGPRAERPGAFGQARHQGLERRVRPHLLAEMVAQRRPVRGAVAARAEPRDVFSLRTVIGTLTRQGGGVLLRPIVVAECR